MIKFCPVTGKPSHNRKTALGRANFSQKKTGIEIHAYKCPFCKAWHLTSKRQYIKGEPNAFT